VTQLARSVVAAALLLQAVSASAAAPEDVVEGAGTVYGRDNWPGQIVKRSLTLPATMIDVKVPLVINLSDATAFDPWWFAPAVGIGFTDDVTLRAYTPERGLGFCLAGEGNGCPKPWNDVGVEVLYGFSRTPRQQLIMRFGAEAYSLSDPLLLALKLGGAYKTSIGNLGLILGGDLRIGVTERDAGNVRESFTVFAEPQLQINEEVAIFGRLTGEVELQPGTGFGISDTLAIPLAAGVEWELMRRVSIGFELGFDNLFGRGGGVGARRLALFGQIFL
jgi:hypothetical protein